MGDRVWQVQKELEDLRATSHGTSEVQTALTFCTFSPACQTSVTGFTTG